MLEWMKSTVKDMRKYNQAEKQARGRLAQRKAREEARKVQAREAERARLMEMSEKELLVEMMLAVQAYGRELEDLRSRLRARMDILERNVEGVAEGMIGLEFDMSCLDAMVTNLEEQLR